MLMNGMKVEFDSQGSTGPSAGGTDFALSVDFTDKVVGGGPPIRFVQVMEDVAVESVEAMSSPEMSVFPISLSGALSAI